MSLALQAAELTLAFLAFLAFLARARSAPCGASVVGMQ